MTPFVSLVVGAGIAAAGVLGIAGGFDVASVLMLLLIVGLGILGIAIARRASAGDVTPAHCASCDGVISPSAPYCKHCGQPVENGALRRP